MLDRHLPYFIAAILAFNIQLAYAVPAQETCHPASKQEITALFDRWNTTLGTGNSDTVTNNYADDAVLLPTLSNQPRTTHAEIKSYFNEFLAKHPHGTILSRNVVVQCYTAYDVGT